jgi:rubrerythrin
MTIRVQKNGKLGITCDKCKYYYTAMRRSKPCPICDYRDRAYGFPLHD